MLQAGDVTGLTGLTPGGRLELRPYAASTFASTRGLEFSGEPMAWQDDQTHSGGLDLKVGVTTTMAADLTINPDFSQIEADALQVDVNQRFALFFPEKRPFFLEGAENFNMPYKLVYTRRMADPAFGTKLAGQLGGFAVNAIALRDDGGGSGSGIGADETGAPYGEGWFAVGRARRDFGGKAHVGFTYTDHFNDSEPSSPRVSERNAVFGVDSRALIGKRWTVDFQGAVSHTRFHDFPVDSGGQQIGDRTEAKNGLLYAFGTWYSDGDLFALLWQDNLEPEFRAETGFIERVDARMTGVEANYTRRPESKWVRAWEPQMKANLVHDFDGEIQERRLAGAVEWTFQKQTRMHTRHVHLIERWLGTDYYRRRYLFELDNSLWRPLSVQFDATLEDGIYYAATDSASFLGWQEYWALTGTARPSPRITSELSAIHSRFTRSRGGEEVYDLWLLGAKTTVQFTRRLYARVYPQWDTGDGHVDVDALVGYVLHPGSVLYLGFNGDADRVNGRRHATGRSVFFKASYAFQR